MNGVSVAAPVDGAWCSVSADGVDLTRTIVRPAIYRNSLMAGPYYLTPCARCWPGSLLRARQEGGGEGGGKRLHQTDLGATLGGTGHLIDNPNTGVRIAWVMALFEGLSRIRHDRRCYEVDGPCA